MTQGQRKFFLLPILAVMMLFSVKIVAFGGMQKAEGPSNPVFVTFVSNHEQIRAVRALIRSVRENAGPVRNGMIYVVNTDPAELSCDSLQTDRVVVLPLEMNRSFADYPLAFKAFAAAQVEKRVRGSARTVIWLDPGVIVLGPLTDLDLTDSYDAALRPVTLANTIGLAPGAVPDDYWGPIYHRTGLKDGTLPVLKTVVDQVEIQPYYNCEVFAFNPQKGVAEEWAGLLGSLLENKAYQNSVCTTFLRRLFLHQAVLSAVLSSRIDPQRIRTLPLSSGYPFSQHGRLDDKQRPRRLNDLAVVIFDTTWVRTPDWMGKIPIDPPLQKTLFDLYLQYLEIAPQIHRIEGSCNAYLVTTDEGSVLIDPAGAAAAPAYFERLIAKHPLRAILLTHAHPDHSDDIARWRKGQDIPVVAQREFKRYFEYAAELEGFFARRNAIWAGKRTHETAAEPWVPQEKPNTFFTDEHEMKIGELTFRMKHTPGETPDHATIFIPKLRAVFVGDNHYEYFINNSTFRGTMIRPILGYIHALEAALQQNPASFLPGHGRPLCSEAEIGKEAGGLLAALKYIYAETLKGINAGKDVHTLMQEVRLPEKYRVRPYFGKVEWTVRGIWQEYVGWFDENPSSMYPQPVSSVFSDLTELAGAEKILSRARDYLDKGDFQKVLHLTDVIKNRDHGRIEALKLRLKALQALKAKTQNFIERIWLSHAIRECEDQL